VGEGEDLTTSITAFTKAIAIKSFEPTFGKSSAMDEPAACKLKLKGKKRGFKPHTKRKIPNKYKEDSERSGFRTSIRKAKSGKVLCTSLR